MYGFIWPESIWFLRGTKRVACGSRPCERSRRDKRRRGRGGRGMRYRRRRERGERKREPSRSSRRSKSQQNNNNETLTASHWHWLELYVFVFSGASGFIRRKEKKRKERKSSGDRWLIHPNTFTLKDHFCLLQIGSFLSTIPVRNKKGSDRIANRAHPSILTFNPIVMALKTN